MSTKLELFNLSAILTTDNSILISHIKKFLSSYYIMRVNSFNNSQLPTYKHFYSKVNNSFYLHINQFKHLISYFKNIGVIFQPDIVEHNEDYKFQIEDIKLKKGWELREYQVSAVDFLINNKTKHISQLIAAPTGSGKAQPLYSLIKIPNDWKAMRDIKINDEIITQDGSTTKVTGIFPQGKKPVYELSFYDGRSCNATDEHLWKVYIDDNISVLTTIQLKEILETTQTKVYIDLIEPEITEDKQFSLDPYIVGFILGNSFLEENSYSFHFNNLDEKVVNKVKSLLPSVYKLLHLDGRRYKLMSIQSIGNDVLYNKLLRIKNHNKIPYLYLESSKEQKLRLLQGFLDNNASIGKQGSITYKVNDYFLVLQLQYLIRSLGGIAYILPRVTIANKLSTFILNIKYKNPNELFSIEEKIVSNSSIEYTKLKLKSIIYLKEEETQCISIEHPSKLYITNDFIVTHNTVMAMAALSELKIRTAFCILPTFIDKWIGDIRGITNLPVESILVIKGSKSLKQLIELSKSNSLDYKIIIFSMRTLQIFISDYEENPELIEEEYGIKPIDLIPLIQAGCLVIDETHMQFHALFKVLLHMNVKKHIGLSATLISDDHVVKNAQNIVFPESTRYDYFEQNRYIDVYPVNYTIQHNSIKYIKTTEYNSNSYSHSALEKSILRNRILTNNYLKLITELVEDYYITGYMKNDKLAIFVTSIALATLLTKHLKTKYPKYSIKRYCENDPYENVIKPDIRITTVLSAGTGLDIPNLRTVIQTSSISSTVSNLQTLGRLRKLKDRDTKFIYIYSNQINKQFEYHLKRKEIFTGKINNLIDRKARTII